MPRRSLRTKWGFHKLGEILIGSVLIANEMGSNRDDAAPKARPEGCVMHSGT